jgi:hypothetical protein
VNDNGDVIRIVECRSAALESGMVEVPFRRSELPDQFGEIAPVFVVAVAATVGGKIELVPPLQLGLGRQRYPTGLLTADQAPQRLIPLQVKGSSAPSLPGKRRVSRVIPH